MYKRCKMALNLQWVVLFGKITFVFMCAVFSVHMAFAKDSPLNRLQSPIAKHITIQALGHIERGEWEQAQDKIAQARDPLASKLFNWLLLINLDRKDWTDVMFARLSHFIRQNDEWPETDRMKVTAEGIMPETLGHDEVLAWYNDFPPQTSYGLRRYMNALLATNQGDKAQKLLIEWWADPKISFVQQKQIFQNYGDLLTVEAHKRRFDALLYAEHYSSALEIADVLGEGYVALAKARIALAKNKSSGLGALIDAVPAALKRDPGLLYERLKWRRQRNMTTGALEILEDMPDTSHVINRADWWRERHIIIRRLLETKQYERAYKLASGHIQKDGVSYAQAQWLAGWLALYFMDRPTEAYERFSVLFTKVETPISRGRAAYWAGRSADALGQNKLARRWYKSAAEYQTTFYGQLAGSVLAIKERLPQSKLPHISARDREEYKKSELIQAANLFRDTGQENRSLQFINAFLYEHEEAKAYRFVAEMLAEQGNYHGAVKIAKKATRKGLFLTKQSYPTITKQLQGIESAEWALIHAIIRQESAFDHRARSHAGALGLMQILPSTAHEVARKLNVGYSKAWLTEKPKYNIRLGASYIGRLLSYYDGNYPLAIAAYNAGPGRVDEWIRLYGDPRQDNISLIDWIELIPIYETRNYVQRVLENVYVYRLRLKDIQKQPEDDLHVAFQ